MRVIGSLLHFRFDGFFFRLFFAVVEEAGFTFAVGHPFHEAGEQAGEHQVAEERVLEEKDRRRKFRVADRQRLPPAGERLRVERVGPPRLRVRDEIEQDGADQAAVEQAEPRLAPRDECAEQQRRAEARRARDESAHRPRVAIFFRVEMVDVDVGHAERHERDEPHPAVAEIHRAAKRDRHHRREVRQRQVHRRQQPVKRGEDDEDDGEGHGAAALVGGQLMGQGISAKLQQPSSNETPSSSQNTKFTSDRRLFSWVDFNPKTTSESKTANFL